MPDVLNGLLAFATTENSIVVFKLDRSSSQLAAKPWLVVDDSQVVSEADGNEVEIEYYQNTDKSKGVFISPDALIFIPLMA